ncbi:hypothetical protein EVAR_47207_1 [Eumeta japonica]|uniref:Uncharacterized protein n=1 Tax=Eumeta variegata TaxID=151549 RepID=A0A4C1XYG9_EUMVA|nr:hypothetical protein EVAR_47207_1 [Eumeta japonica]
MKNTVGRRYGMLAHRPDSRWVLGAQIGPFRPEMKIIRPVMFLPGADLSSTQRHPNVSPTKISKSRFAIYAPVTTAGVVRSVQRPSATRFMNSEPTPKACTSVGRAVCTPKETDILSVKAPRRDSALPKLCSYRARHLH